MNWHVVSAVFGACVLFGGAMLLISGLPSMVAGRKKLDSLIDARRQSYGLATLLAGLMLVTFGVNPSVRAFVTVFEFFFIGWALCLSIQIPVAKELRSLQSAAVWVLLMLTFVVRSAIELNTRVSIDQWSGRDCWNGAFLLATVFCTGLLFQHLAQVWDWRKKTSRAD